VGRRRVVVLVTYCSYLISHLMAVDLVKIWPKEWVPSVATSATSRAASSKKREGEREKSSGSPIDL